MGFYIRRRIALFPRECTCPGRTRIYVDTGLLNVLNVGFGMHPLKLETLLGKCSTLVPDELLLMLSLQTSLIFNYSDILL